jgi:ActR/RegA family two-component response regulator
MLPLLGEVQQLLDLLSGSNNDLITVEQLQRGLVSLGYLLEPSEVLELAQALGYGVENSEGVAVSQFAASQLDWEAIQVGGWRPLSRS